MYIPKLKTYTDFISERAIDAINSLEGVNKESFLKNTQKNKCPVLCNMKVIGKYVPKVIWKFPGIVESSPEIPWLEMEKVWGENFFSRFSYVDFNYVWGAGKITLPKLLDDLPNIKLPTQKQIRVFNKNHQNPALIFEENRDVIRELISKYENFKNPRIFGSVLYGTSVGGSDVDILVDKLPKATDSDKTGLQANLEYLLGVPVDLSTSDELDYFSDDDRNRVLLEAQTL